MLVACAALVVAAPRPPRRAGPFSSRSGSRSSSARPRAEGAQAYAALRRIWATWDRADPTHVEEALLDAERSPRSTPAVRAYAGLLAAYARSRRGDFKGAREKIKKLGFVDRWLVVGPFDNEGKTGFDVEIGPERDFAQPIVPGRAYSGKERPVRWRNVPLAFPYGWLDSSALLRPERRICLFATTLRFGGQGFARAAPDQRLGRHRRRVQAVLERRGRAVGRRLSRATTPIARRRCSSSCRVGTTCTIKVCGDDTAPVLSLRLADARGAPDPNLVARKRHFARAPRAAESGQAR